MFAGHGRGSDGGDDVCEGLVRADNRGRSVVIVIGRGYGILGRVGRVVVVRVGGEGTEADGDTGGLEAGRVEGDDADGVVAIGQEIFDSNGGFLG